MRKAKSTYFRTKITQCSYLKDMKKSWSIINSLLGKGGKSSTIAEFIIDNHSVSDPSLIAEELNNYFINIGPTLAAECCSSTERNADISNATNLDTRFCFSPISITTTLNNLNKLKTSKATGLDKIPAKSLKISSTIIAPSLTYIFNLSITTGIFMDDWKDARVTPIYKSDDRRKCENYRPISILSVVNKIFEKAVFEQLYYYLNDNSLLSRFQSGFRPGHSTLSLLIQMCDHWLENLDNGELNGIVSIDIKKAFDSINHSVLLNKMNEQFGIRGIELRWFQSYLSKRRQVCIVNGHSSSFKEIICGVPQGSILGPLLFLLYINDLPSCLETTTPGLFADDTQIYTSSSNFTDLVNKLNQDLENVCKWLSNNKLQHHPTKTKLMFIGSTHSLKNIINDYPVEINDKPVTRCSSFKCLGVHLDEKLSWDKHIEYICAKIGAGIGVMRRVKPYVTKETLLNIYNAIVLPYFDYCSPLWDKCGSMLKEKLQKLQNRAARVISGASYETPSSEVLQALSWKGVEERHKKTKSVLMYKVLNNHTAPSLRASFIRMRDTQYDYQLRNRETDLVIPKPRNEYLKKSFKYSGAVMWNALSADAKSSVSLNNFKRLSGF